MDSKLEKLARLALCQASPEGEWQSAAVAFFKFARSSGESFERLLAKKDTRKIYTMSGFYFKFGKHKGKPIENVDTDYLFWCLENLEQISPHFRNGILFELNRRKNL